MPLHRSHDEVLQRPDEGIDVLLGTHATQLGTAVSSTWHITLAGVPPPMSAASKPRFRQLDT